MKAFYGDGWGECADCRFPNSGSVSQLQRSFKGCDAWGEELCDICEGLGLDSAWRHHEANLRECGSAVAYDPCLPNQFAFRLSGSDKIVTGTGDFPECLKETITLLGCPHKACADGQLCIYSDISANRVGCLLKDPLTGKTLMKFDEN